MRRLVYLFLSCAALATAAGCADDKDLTAGPKEYEVQYQVTSTNTSVADFISYTNASNTTTIASSPRLPANYTFKRTMKLGDMLLVTATLDGGTAASEVTASILLDGIEVKKTTGRGPKAQALSSYTIK